MTSLIQNDKTKNAYVVYFDQLSGAAHIRKLVKIDNTPVFEYYVTYTDK